MEELLKFVTDVGFPIAACSICGYFIFLTLRFILDDVSGSIKGLSGIIQALNNRVKTMNHDVIRIDTLISNALGIKPDIDRIARSDGKEDTRKD
jgi:hypothetical protein